MVLAEPLQAKRLPTGPTVPGRHRNRYEYAEIVNLPPESLDFVLEQDITQFEKEIARLQETLAKQKALRAELKSLGGE
jgi:hypothetical protein